MRFSFGAHQIQYLDHLKKQDSGFTSAFTLIFLENLMCYYLSFHLIIWPWQLNRWSQEMIQNYSRKIDVL